MRPRRRPIENFDGHARLALCEAPRNHGDTPIFAKMSELTSRPAAMDKRAMGIK
jgi:hypothetical protein